MKVSTGTLTEGQLNWLIARRLGGDLRFPHLNRAASDLPQGGTIIIDEKLSVAGALGTTFAGAVATVAPGAKAATASTSSGQCHR